MGATEKECQKKTVSSSRLYLKTDSEHQLVLFLDPFSLLS